MVKYSKNNNNGPTSNLTDDSSENSLDHDMASEYERYVVLYNGNAEVIGNFRALNFYKASDINLKEDVRLLAEGKLQSFNRVLTLFFSGSN